jgi:hypothetical protein
VVDHRARHRTETTVANTKIKFDISHVRWECERRRIRYCPVLSHSKQPCQDISSGSCEALNLVPLNDSGTK